MHLLKIILIPVTLLALTPSQAQNNPTAAKQLSLDVFGGFSHVSPDYGAPNNNGFLLGGDVSRSVYHLVPSFEVRYEHTHGSIVGEGTTSAGLKVAKDFHRFHPYGDFLVGYGVITYDHPIIYSTGPYASDNSIIYSFGGGLDYGLTHNFAAKLDFQYQIWHIGDEASAIRPTAVNIGVQYTIPFRTLPGRRR